MGMIDWIAERPALLLAFFAIILIPVVIISMKQQQEWESWCVSQNGHVDKVTKWATGVSGKSTTTTSTTTYFCLTSDGRILDIR